MSLVIQLHLLTKDSVKIGSWQRLILDRLQECFPSEHLSWMKCELLVCNWSWYFNGQYSQTGIWEKTSTVNIVSDCQLNEALLYKDETIQFILLLCKIVSPIFPRVFSSFSVEVFQLVPYCVHCSLRTHTFLISHLSTYLSSHWTIVPRFGPWARLTAVFTESKTKAKLF